MKPPPFEYIVATSTEHAIEVLSQHEDAKVIAGGQSLIPLLTLRFASPTLLVDISRIPELRTTRVRGGSLEMGALTRHADVEHDPVIREAAPLFAAAAPWVAHPQIRNRGTLGGSVAHSDTAAEFPAVLLALDGTVVTRSRTGERRIAAVDFFGPHFQPDLRPGELLVAVEVPVADTRTRWGFSEFARRKGDYAIGGAAVCVRLDDDARCVSVRGGLISAGPGPTSANGLHEELVGHRVDEVAIGRAVNRVVATQNPGENVHGTKEYRRAVIGESLRRALHQAFEFSGADMVRRTA